MPLSSRFEQALVHAAQLHAAQRRKGTETPYISHLLAVTAIVLEHGGNEDEAIAALLHDAVEDQGGADTLAEIRRRYGDAVADIVSACSDTDQPIKPPWRERKEAYLEHLRTVSPSVRLISAADKLHNARSTLAGHRRIGPQVWERFNGGQSGTLWYLRSVVNILREQESTPLVDELDRVVGELEALAQT